MSIIKRILAKALAFLVVKKIESSYNRSIQIQNKIFNELIRKASKTKFGLHHKFSSIKTIQDYRKRVPVRDYEQINKYIKYIKEGKKDILWPGRPKYLAKTSGTTSGMKFIPITKESMPNHIISSRNALLFYINKTGNTKFLNGKTIFLQGSPVLENIKGVFTGRLSGIVAHHIPSYLKKNNLPSLETNSIDNWEEKVDAICEETIDENMTVIGGIPSWIQMFFEKIILKSNKKNISDIFKNFTLYIYGGVNFSPYEGVFRKLIGKQIDTIEYYPASEGFFAYQNCQSDKSLLLQFNSGIFYEFIVADDFESSNYKRLSLKDVQLGINYILVISSNAGLWAYNTGDTIRFTSLNPPKILVTGRYKHFISAFGEHVISEEVEQSIAEISKSKKINILEFTVAPMTNPKIGLPYHEWWIEFEEKKIDLKSVSMDLDKKMKQKNTYYKDLVEGSVLRSLKIIEVRRGGFKDYMKSIGKLGGQNKVPKLSNNRIYVEGLKNFIKN